MDSCMCEGILIETGLLKIDSNGTLSLLTNHCQSRMSKMELMIVCRFAEFYFLQSLLEEIESGTWNLKVESVLCHVLTLPCNVF